MRNIKDLVKDVHVLEDLDLEVIEEAEILSRLQDPKEDPIEVVYEVFKFGYLMGVKANEI